jgi:hypothetical protein
VQTELDFEAAITNGLKRTLRFPDLQDNVMRRLLLLLVLLLMVLLLLRLLGCLSWVAPSSV